MQTRFQNVSSPVIIVIQFNSCLLAFIFRCPLYFILFYFIFWTWGLSLTFFIFFFPFARKTKQNKTKLLTNLKTQFISLFSAIIYLFLTEMNYNHSDQNFSQHSNNNKKKMLSRAIRRVFASSSSLTPFSSSLTSSTTSITPAASVGVKVMNLFFFCFRFRFIPYFVFVFLGFIVDHTPTKKKTPHFFLSSAFYMCICMSTSHLLLLLLLLLLFVTKQTISASFASPINEGYSGETYERKESAQERAFINKQEQAILKNLVKKYESQIDPHGVDENNKLEFIFHKHKTPLSKELREDLKAWKHS